MDGIYYASPFFNLSGKNRRKRLYERLKDSIMDSKFTRLWDLLDIIVVADATALTYTEITVITPLLAVRFTQVID